MTKPSKHDHIGLDIPSAPHQPNRPDHPFSTPLHQPDEQRAIQIYAISQDPFCLGDKD